MKLRAFTRAVSPKLAECELTHLERTPIDADRAVAQHGAYEAELKRAGYELIRLPDLPHHPDGVFVEDTALLLGGHAVILRPGVESRAAETESTTAGLADHFEIHRVTSGHVDGGDVLRIGNRLYVGLSTRSDAEGVADLRKIVAPLGFEVVSAQLRDCLHLKTGATLASESLLLYAPLSIDPAQFADVEPFAVDANEPSAANCLRLADRIILPVDATRTASRLRDRGLNVVQVDVSELQKAEAGLTCMSLIEAG